MKKLTTSLLLLGILFSGACAVSAAVKKVTVKKPVKKVVVRKKRASIVHTKILDANLIDPTKPPFN